MYRACDSARSVAALSRLASAELSRPVDAAEIVDCLAPYLERGLLIEEGGQLLALAVAARPDANDRAPEEDAPVDVHAAGGRTFLPMA